MKINRLQEFLDTIKYSNKQLLESKNLDKTAENALAHKVIVEGKAASIASAKYNDYITYELEEVDGVYFILKRARYNDLSEENPEIVDSRTKLTDKEAKRIDPKNYESSLLELAVELDNKQGRFGL